MAHHDTSTSSKAKYSASKSKLQQASLRNLPYFATTSDPASPYISPYASAAESQHQLQTSPNSPALTAASFSSHGSSDCTTTTMSSSAKISPNEKAQLIRSLHTHKVNTLLELRHIEKIFSTLNPAEVTEPLKNAWAHYVNSNNLLSELRGLTKNYPFSSDCLDEAKVSVIGESGCSRNYNFCWLVLSKIRKNGLITRHARLLAAKPVMWGGRTPTAAGVEKLAAVCVAEWTRALDQMLNNWTSAPSIGGR